MAICKEAFSLIGIIAVVLFGVVATALNAQASVISSRGLNIDDVLGESRIDAAAFSPDGDWLIVTVQRPAEEGEIFGRTYYETDPSRDDLWLISTLTGERRNITNGAASASGFWCATWSPDGAHVAMLSTHAEGQEPRGGNNVRIYIWDRLSDTIRRMSDDAAVTQPRYGAGLYRLDIRGGPGRGGQRTCNGNENAPFAWVDSRRLVAVMTEAGDVSGLLDENGQSSRHAQATSDLLREGQAPTGSAVDSRPKEASTAQAVRQVALAIFDVETGSSKRIGTLPFYPFTGSLTVSLSPNGQSLAILAPNGRLTVQSPISDESTPDAFRVDYRLGFGDINRPDSLSWLGAEATRRFPLALFEWSPLGDRIAFAARGSATELAGALFETDGRSVIRLSPPSLSFDPSAIGSAAYASPAVWVDQQQILARLRGSDQGGSTVPLRGDWRLLSNSHNARNMTEAFESPPTQMRRRQDGSLVAISDTGIFAFDSRRGGFDRLGDLPDPGSVICETNASAVGDIALVHKDGPHRSMRRIDLTTGQFINSARVIPGNADILDFDRQCGYVWRVFNRLGQMLVLTRFDGHPDRQLLLLNENFGTLQWGAQRILTYSADDGSDRTASIIFPPGTKSYNRLPVIVWTYPGQSIVDLNDYFMRVDQPGFYNLHLYAARGYAVLIPSIPLPTDRSAIDLPARIEAEVGASVDAAIAQGYVDPNRIGILGQSFGGYAAFALATRTSRYRAVVAISGISDLLLFSGEFDRTARGYGSIEHERSVNPMIRPLFGLTGRIDEDLNNARLNSPIWSVGSVTTPVLMLHGELDARSSTVQSEQFFSALSEKGSSARLVRYWGENHAISLSPANVRSVFAETMEWFDYYVLPLTKPSK